MILAQINKCIDCGKTEKFTINNKFSNNIPSKFYICADCMTNSFKQESLNIFNNLDSKGVDLTKLKEIEDKINKEFKNEYKNR